MLWCLKEELVIRGRPEHNMVNFRFKAEEVEQQSMGGKKKKKKSSSSQRDTHDSKEVGLENNLVPLPAIMIDTGNISEWRGF